MKKLIATLLCIAMLISCLALAACDKGTGANNGGNAADGFAVTGDTITIGVYEPASGDNGAGGKQETLGVKYANDVKKEVTVGGKTYKVELAIVDNQSSNDKAISAATELINKGSLVVLGSYGSGVSIAASETFKNAGVGAIGVTCTNPQVTAGNSHYFRVCFLDPFQGTVLANYAKDAGADRAYVIAQQGNDYDVGLANYFKQAFGDESTYTYETFPLNTADFSAYVQKAIDEEADVIFAPTSISYAQLIIDAAKAKGYTGTILAGDTWDSNKVIEAAQNSDLDIQVTTFYQEGGNAEFDKGFAEWLNADAQRTTENGGNTMIAAVSVMGYDAYMTALYAIESIKLDEGASLTRQAVIDALAAMNSADNAYTGVTGVIYFDATGDAVRDTAFIKKVDTAAGVWSFVKEQKAQ